MKLIHPEHMEYLFSEFLSQGPKALQMRSCECALHSKHAKLIGIASPDMHSMPSHAGYNMAIDRWFLMVFN